jgi:hypothetical protein
VRNRPEGRFQCFEAMLCRTRSWNLALLAAVQLVSGGRRYPLEIQAVAKSSQGATSRSYELSAACFWLRLGAVAQLAGNCRASLGRERQCGLEYVRGSALHGLILAVQTRCATRPRATRSRPRVRLHCATADAARGAATRSGGCRPNRSDRAEQAPRPNTRTRLHRLVRKPLSARELQMSVALNPRGVLCRASVVSGHRRQWRRGVSNPLVLPRHPSRTLFGGCSRPACRCCCQHRDRTRETARETL